MYMLYKAITRSTILPFPTLPPDADTSNIPDTVDNHSIGSVIVASLVPITIISTLPAFARLFVKGWVQRRIQYDDGILLLAVASGWTATGTTLKAVSLGHGKHVALLTDSQKEEAFRWQVMAFAFGIIALALPKVAIVALVNRLLQPNRLHRFFLWIMVLLCVTGLLGNVIGLYAECPQEAVVQITYTKTACLGPERAVAYSISTSAISAATNGYLAIYAAFAVRRLKVTRRKRLALAISLVLGVLALLTAIFKCTRLKSLGSPDFTYDSADLIIWTSLEANVVIIAACIPALQPLVDHHFPDHLSTPASSPSDTVSRISRGSQGKSWHGFNDLEAGRGSSLSTQAPEMIMVEREFKIAYSRASSSTTPCTSDFSMPSMQPEERLQIIKDYAPGGSITTTVVVKFSTRPPNHPAFPAN
ncbi:uncharacterized protein GLRG_09686 [Colletotrichum graminicola M1.001]|uniref:Rhodopsin domain-containing protein n=1 Tax=Colletotrichum graminicola (strain M1.001 / M2 / FGSC 10212) TaxID=645133 RepID=E3QUK4_COLGM|nr:uncharacterized protein GLRG_09686 [Colletotrichum graminicola M1.001]EFQ34542.1 hypothetical protein GLRG_09686 [Colletotrichum graminicola M1.001]